MGKRSREKGAQAERAAAAILRLIHPEAKRRVSGEEGQGEQLGRDLKGTPGLCVQVKETGAPQPLAALEQAISACVADEIAVALVRQSRMGASTPFRVVLTLRDWLFYESLRRHSQTIWPATYLARREVIDEAIATLAEADAAARARIG